MLTLERPMSPFIELLIKFVLFWVASVLLVGPVCDWWRGRK